MERSDQISLFLRVGLLTLMIAWLGLTPQSHQFQRGLSNARQAIARHHMQTASEQLASAAEEQPWRADLWEQAGIYALKADKPEQAIEYLEKAATTNHSTTISPQGGLSAYGLIALGDAYQQTGDLNTAIHFWQAAEARLGLDRTLSERLVQAYLEQDEYQAAIAELQKLVAAYPNDPELRYQLGLLLATQQPETALEHMKQVAEMDSNLSKDAQELRGQILNAQAEDDSPAYSLLAAGRALASANEWKLAVEAFRQATILRPDYAEAWAYLGQARWQLALQETTVSDSDSGANGNPRSTAEAQKLKPDGLTELQKALELDPNSLSTHLALAMYWKQKGHYTQALQSIQAAIQIEPDRPILQVELGDLLALNGDLEEAYQAYIKAIELAPNDPTYLGYLVGFSLRYNYLIDQIALPVARQAVILAPNDPTSLDWMAQVMIHLGDLASAERFLLRALQADANYAPAHLHLGLVYILQGNNSSQARNEFKLAYSLAPESPTADQAIRFLEMYFPESSP